MEKKRRNPTLDIIRIVALFCVVSWHFFCNSDFDRITVEGPQMFVMTILRSIFVICVPMFIILTGYLMNKKELSKKYYKGAIKTIVIYIIFSVIFHIFAKLHLNQDVTIWSFIKDLLAYKGTTYAWYIEMYLGLFILIPFFNIIFNNLNEKQVKILLWTLVATFGLHGILNTYKEFGSWWLMPSADRDGYIKIVPSWWKNVYPIFYYYLGAYFARYKVNMSAKKNILLWIVAIIIDGIYNFWRSRGGTFIWGDWNDYSSLNVMILSFLAFNLLLKINFKKENNIRDNILKHVSNSILGAYLISCMFDKIVYEDYLKKLVPNVNDRFIYAPIVVMIVFVLSILLSMMVNVIYDNIAKFIKNKQIKENI